MITDHIWIIALAILIIVVWLIIKTYNNIIDAVNQANSAESTIDIILKKRFDLIPNIVATVKRYLEHEINLHTKLTTLRSKTEQKELNRDEKIDLNNQLDHLLGYLQVRVEAYPNLMANENIMILQRTLTEVEAQLSAARRTSNAAITYLNNLVDMFPTNIFCYFMHVKKHKLLSISTKERINPNIYSNFNRD